MGAGRKEWMINLASIELNLREACIKRCNGCKEGQNEQKIKKLTAERKKVIQKGNYEALEIEELGSWFQKLDLKKNNMRILRHEMGEDNKAKHLEKIQELYGELIYRNNSPMSKMDSKYQLYQLDIALNDLYIAWLYAR